MCLHFLNKLLKTRDTETEVATQTVEAPKVEYLDLKVVRDEFTDKYTMGKLYVNGEYYCDTLEDTVRDGEKVYGETAIPYGTYDVILTFSPKFKRQLPLLLNVPNFEGIRIHNGSYPEDSLGCILIGERFAPGMLTNSKKTINKFMDFLTVEALKHMPFRIEITSKQTNK